MTEEIEKLVEMAFSDGVLTDKEKEILFRKAEKLGIDFDEFEMYLESRVALAQKANAKLAVDDSFDISNQELLIRTQKWVSLTGHETYNGKIEKFPSVKQTGNALLSTGKAIGVNLLGAVGSNFKSKVSFSNPMNYVRLVSQIASSDKKENERKIKHSEIVELANGYLTILEMRSINDEFLRTKFEEYLATNQRNIDNFNAKKNTKWIKKIF